MSKFKLAFSKIEIIDPNYPNPGGNPNPGGDPDPGGNPNPGGDPNPGGNPIEGPGLEYVYLIENAEYPLMNGYYKFKGIETDDWGGRIFIYENENGESVLKGYEGIEWALESSDGYITTGPVADHQVPENYVEWWYNFDEEEASSLTIKRVNKQNILNVSGQPIYENSNGEIEVLIPIDGSYYEVPELNESLGYGKPLYAKACTNFKIDEAFYIAYSPGENLEEDEWDCPNPYYGIVSNLTAYEPAYRILGDNPKGTYTWTGHPSYITIDAAKEYVKFATPNVS